MRKFLKHITLFITLSILITVTGLFILIKFYGPYIDPFYSRFTDYHRGGLIIGTSRAAQAIEPSCFGNNTYNFSFTVKLSPFDSTYLKLIKKYHPVTSYDSQRLHIISVDPWGLWTYQNQAEEIINPSFEKIVAAPVSDPNYHYIYHFVQLLKAFGHAIKSDHFVNAGGRYVVKMDSAKINTDETYIKSKIAFYTRKKEYLEGNLSQKRLSILNQIIDYLGKDGKVVMVRLPVHQQMYEIETTMAPEFDQLMQTIALQKQVQYLNLMPYRDQYLYTDGNHIWDGHSKRLSERIREGIE